MRLLRPLFVANPYAQSLTFLDSLARTRRDHAKYLTLIRAVTLLHQHQRPLKTAAHRGKTIEYIEVEPADIATANRLMAEVPGRSLDELPPQTKRLLLLIDEMVKEQCAALTQIRIHLDRLQEMEFLVAHRGGRGQTFLHELVFGREDLYQYDLNLTVSEVEMTGSKRGQNGGVTGTWRGAETRMNTGVNGVLRDSGTERISVGA